MVPYDWVLSLKPCPVLLELLVIGESCDSGRGWDSHLIQVRKEVYEGLLRSSLPTLFFCNPSDHLFLEFSLDQKDLAELGPCLALGIWCLLFLLQFSTLRLLTSSQRSPAGWAHRRSSSPGLCSATSSCAVTCSLSPANRLCYWPLSL